MVWNKTNEETVKAILKALEEMNKTSLQIAQEFEVSEWLVCELSRKFLSKENRKLRHSLLARKSKVGNQNPMYGKDKLQHHNAIDGAIVVAGYLAIFAPDWWEGTLVKGTRAFEHHIIWAENNGKTKLPSGCVIHHIDENKYNNSPENLVCLTRAEHMKLHSEIRKVQRLSRKGVENSVLEAQEVRQDYEIV